MRTIPHSTQTASLYPPLGDTMPELEQMRHDAVVTAALDELLGPLRSATTETPPLADTAATLEIIYSALWRGFAAAAITRADRIHLTQLDDDTVSFALRPDASIHSVTWAVDGHSETLHAGQFLCARWRSSPKNPWGQSILRPAIRAFRARDRLLNLWGQTVQRAGHPLLIATVPPGTPAATVAAIRAELDDLSVTTTAVIPSDVTVVSIQPTYASTVSHAELLAYLDSAIRRSITLRDTGSSVLSGKILETGTSVAARDTATRARCAELAHWANSTLRSAGLPEQPWPDWLTQLSPERDLT